VRRARARAEAADLILWLVDAATGQGAAASGGPAAAGAPVWLVKNKIDLVGAPPSESVGAAAERKFSISAATGLGVEALVSAIAEFARASFGGGEAALVTRERHRKLLEETAAALDRALAEGAGEGREDAIAEELRLAARALGRLTGRVDVEDVLDVIFRDFCIGK
jgi:tRNA modification GTPase